jgi:hypothetical protein
MPNSRIDDDTNMSVHDFVDRLSQELFFGTVSLSFQSGRVVNLRKEQNLKPNELPSGKPENYVNSKQS